MFVELSWFREGRSEGRGGNQDFRAALGSSVMRLVGGIFARMNQPRQLGDVCFVS